MSLAEQRRLFQERWGEVRARYVRAG